MAIDFNKIPSPCYVLDESLLRRNLEIISRVQKEAGVEIIMAFKGFAMWSVFPMVHQYIKGATASSAFEARLAIDEMKSLAHTYAAVYRDVDFGNIMECSSHITFNSVNQLKRFLPRIKAFSRPLSVGLRVNPEYSEVGTALYNPCSPGSRLGVLHEDLGNELPEGVDGLHFHALCESDAENLEQTLVEFEKRFGKLIPKVKWVNMGGGHLMTRKGYDIDHLIRILKDFKKRYSVHVILEPGAVFAWETGYLVSTVEDIVDNRGLKTAMLDVSFTAHMPDCLEMPYKPRIMGSYFEPVTGKPTYRMGGNSCLSGDFVGDWSFDKELKIGDRIIFEDMIHYTMVKTTFFNGVQHPAIGIWTEQDEFRKVREFGYDDYKNKLS
jgi:carboxynorspermidine decarboxylase